MLHFDRHDEGTRTNDDKDDSDSAPESASTFPTNPLDESRRHELQPFRTVARRHLVPRNSQNPIRRSNLTLVLGGLEVSAWDSHHKPV